MKTKIKNTQAVKAKKRPTSASRKKIVVVHAKHLVLRHFKLIEHRHTGKLIHFRHTSHFALMLVLMVVGLFLYADGNLALAQTSEGSVLIGAIVPGPPPAIGATITSPTNGASLVGNPITEIKGTCESNTFVVVRSNGLTIGSINCSGTGVFNLQVQLQIGKNVLSALDYDNMNQPGPITPSVTVYLTESGPSGTESKPVDTVELIPEEVLKVIPDNPSIITGVSKLSDCTDYNPGQLPTGGKLHISIVCVPRLFFPGIQHQIGLIVWGGQPPYALSINWGKELASESSEQATEKTEDTLLSIEAPGYRLVKFNYVVPGTYRVIVLASDNKGKNAVIQTAIQVNGQTAESTITSSIKDILNSKTWFESPVPFYLLAIAITLGFWGGDIFDRKFGASKFRARSRRTA